MTSPYAPTPSSDPSFGSRWAMCFRKVRFYSVSAARQKAKKLNDSRLFIYSCPVGPVEHWHLTHRPKFEGVDNIKVRSL